MFSIKVKANRTIRAGLRLGVLALMVIPAAVLSVKDLARQVGARSLAEPMSTFITVNSLLDTVDGGDGKCTLREAITAANTDTASGSASDECPAGSGFDSIIFLSSVTGTITLTGTQLTISSDLQIIGPGARKLVISGNNASRVFQITAGSVQLLGLTISQGRGIGATGGGVTNSSTLLISDCIISNNSAGANGGGVFSNSTLTINSSTINDNSSDSQGGGLRFLGTATITNSTISGNSAVSGGGISASTGTLTLNHVTISNNTASTSGGGISGGSSGAVTLSNTIVAGNFHGSTRDDLFGTFNVNSSFNLIGDGTGMTGLTNGMNGNQVGNSGSPISPLIGPLQFNGGPTMTRALLTGSPAIDKGNSTLPDQRGLTRPSDDAAIANATGGNGADIGAVELQSGENVLVNSLADTDDGVCNVSNCTLREAIAAANANPTHNAIYFAVTGTIERAGGQLTIDSDVTINGPGARALTVHGNGTSRVFEIRPNRTSALYGMTISEGTYLSSDSAGGGVFNQGTLAVGECVVSDNKSAFGGGGLRNTGILEITNSTISGNLSDQDLGGGIYNAGTLSISNSTITGNVASRYGGGMVNFGRATLTNTTITNNRCETGIVVGFGGGITAFPSSTSNLTLHNSLVAGNFRGFSGGVDDINGSVDTRSSFNLVGNGNGLVGLANGTNGNQIGTSGSPVNPLLSPLQFSGGGTPTHALLPNSPAIDKGNSALNRDQRGLLQPVDLPAVTNATGGNGSDIGAVETAALEHLVVNVLADTNDGVCNAANCTLREAVNAANASLDFNLITFAVTGTITLSGTHLVLNSDLAINNPSTNNLSIDGNNASRIFLVEDNRTVTLSFINLSNGHASGDPTTGGGGAIRQEPASHLSVDNCAISNSQVDAGTGSAGGGIRNVSATLVVNRSLITGNVAQSGGGVYSEGKTFISNSSISGNTALSSGGGILNRGTLVIINSSIIGNIAQNVGGGIADSNAGFSATIDNSTISENSARLDGGGIYHTGGTIILTNMTVTRNHSDSDNNGTGAGGGIRPDAGAVTLHNSLVAGNFRGSGTTARDDLIGSFITSSSFNLIGDGTGMTGLTNGTNGNRVGTFANPIDPRLGPLVSYGGFTVVMHALLPGSPALDAGSNALVTSTADQRGGRFRRIADGPDADTIQTVDVGAFEADPSIEDIPDKTTAKDTPLSFVFNVGDVNLASVSASATSTNTSLVPSGNIVITGSNTSSTRTFQITPAAGQTGQTIITVTVSSGGQSMNDSFVLTVTTTPPPAILTEVGTNNVAALNSVTFVREPFRLLDPHNFSSDQRTRIIFFTSDLGLTQPDSSVLTVQASGVNLPVESVGALSGVAGLNASYIIVRLPNGLPTGSLQLTITLHGLVSNATVLNISP